MKKAAVFLADGFEEGEALFVVDVLRRAGMQCDMVSIDQLMVKGSHDIVVQADTIISDELRTYDMLILPGGQPGATNLSNDRRVIQLVQYFAQEPEKFLGAICAAPMVFAKAGIISGKKITSYPGKEYESLFTEADYVEDIVAIDGHLITSRGPATVLPFAYALVDALGGDSSKLKQAMLYNMAKASQY